MKTSNLSQLTLEAKSFLGIRSLMPKPHFLGIGTQKGGTTSLYRILKQHQQIFLPENKEIHYFTKFFTNEREWYTNHFKEAKAGQLRGEITPYYLFHEAVPYRIKNFNRQMKFIVLLRDPVERALSQYFHSVRLGLEDLCIEDAIENEDKRLLKSKSRISIPGQTDISHQEHSYISRSRYEIQLKRYLKLFKSANFLILRSEDLFESNLSILDSISNFLGTKEFDPRIKIPKENQGLGEANNVSLKMRRQIRHKLSETYNWVQEETGISWADIN